MTFETAETIAFKALALLAATPESLKIFLESSGLDAATIRARAADPDFLAGMLDFLLRDEMLLISFCESEFLDAREIHLAAHRLAESGKSG